MLFVEFFVCVRGLGCDEMLPEEEVGVTDVGFVVVDECDIDVGGTGCCARVGAGVVAGCDRDGDCCCCCCVGCDLGVVEADAGGGLF